MNEYELVAFSRTLHMCAMCGILMVDDMLAELQRQCEYAKIIDEVSK